MKQLSPLLEALIEHLQCLPGVGRKSAQRMALHLLERDRAGGRALAHSLGESMERVRRCSDCRLHTEMERCPLCVDQRRDTSLLCVVESPADVLAIEQTGQYRGRYFVLHGRLSPLDGMGPRQLGFDALLGLLDALGVEEVIVATSMTAEGEATAHYLAELIAEMNDSTVEHTADNTNDDAPGASHPLVRRVVQVSRIAHGIPIGGNIDLVNGMTLSYALSERKRLSVHA